MKTSNSQPKQKTSNPRLGGGVTSAAQLFVRTPQAEGLRNTEAALPAQGSWPSAHSKQDRLTAKAQSKEITPCVIAMQDTN
jgi:hypothetical protein